MYLHKIDKHKIDIIVMHGMALNSRHVLNLPSLHQSATIRNVIYENQIYIPMLYNLS